MLRHLVLASLCLSLACDSQDKPAPKKTAAAKKSAGKAAADDKKAESKADPKAEAKPAKKHLEISHDKSGALPRAAAVLEAEGIDNEDLQALSHHAEKLPTNAEVCKHLAEVHGEGDSDACVEELEHVIARLGPELYGEVSACFMASKTVPALDACFAAEKDAEKELHEKKHGEGLDKATCEKFFTKFEDLAMKATGDEKDHVKKALDTVKDDIVVACEEQGSKAEMECVEKAKTLHELKECVPEARLATS